MEASVAYAQSARDSKMAAIALVPDKITASLTDDLSKENAVSPEIIADFIRKTGIKESDAGQMLRKTTLGSLSDRAKKITDYMQQMDITPKGLQAIIDQGPPKQSITLTLSGMEAVFFTSPTVKYSVRNIPKEALPTCTDRATWWAKASKTDKKDYLLALHLNKVFQMDTKTNVCPACQGTGEIEMNIDKNATRRATDPTIAASYEKQKVTCTSCWGTKIDRVTLTVK